jgi:hypothetical protein
MPSIAIERRVSMYVINRSVAVIRPKQPYVDWANSVSNDGRTYSLEELSEDCSVILLPEYDSDQHADAILRDLYPRIFEVELYSWSVDSQDWPKKRDFSKFSDWFDVELHSMVFDPSEDDIEKEPHDV